MLVLLLTANSVVNAQTACPPTVQASAQITQLKQARRLVIDTARPDPAHMLPGVVIANDVVDLPDRIEWRWRSERYRLHYTLALSDCGVERGSALSLFRVGGPYQAVANDATGSSTTRPVTTRPALALWADRPTLGTLQADARVLTYNGRMPTLLALPEGTTTVEIALQAMPYLAAGLTLAAFGPGQQLIPTSIETAADVVGYGDVASAVLLVLASLLLLLWLRRRKDFALGWLALACIAWSLRGMVYFGALVRMEPIWFELFNPFSVLLAALALTMSTLHFLGPLDQRQRRVVLVVACTGVGALALVLALGQGHALARAAALLLAYLLTVWLIMQIWRQRRQLGQARSQWLLIGLVVLLVCAAHDLMLTAGLRPPTSPVYLFWGFAAVLLGFTAISGEHIAASLNLSERSNEELERRSAAKSIALERSYLSLHESRLAGERSAARADERERLLRDMHDGVSGQLILALRGLERQSMPREQVMQALQDGIDEMRLLMDSGDLGRTLHGALVAWRSRWEPRIESLGMQLRWQIDDTLETVVLAPDRVLDVMRIVQEATVNVVKHARASELSLRAC